MRNLLFLLFCLIITGCQSVPSEENPYFATAIEVIDVDNLNQYWVNEGRGRVMLSGRPRWLPKGNGEWTVQIVIDSNGNEVERTLIDCSPAGFITQEKIDEMPQRTFAPAPSNKERVPVKFISTAKIAARGNQA